MISADIGLIVARKNETTHNLTNTADKLSEGHGIIRVVRMAFKPEESDNFVKLYRAVEPHIRAFDGCEHVELYQEISDEHAYTTYSLWRSPDALEAYRQSDLFGKTWSAVKQMLRAKAAAVSYRKC